MDIGVSALALLLNSIDGWNNLLP